MKNLIDKIMQHKMKILGLVIVVLGLSFLMEIMMMEH